MPLLIYIQREPPASNCVRCVWINIHIGSTLHLQKFNILISFFKFEVRESFFIVFFVKRNMGRFGKRMRKDKEIEH